MRQLALIASAALLATLAACGVRKIETTPATVTYAYENADEYREVEEKAARHCAEEYQKGAVLVDRVTDGDDYEATFACE